ncbi:MAG: hypothetical protein CM15mP115_16490 [Alphaproteobacteria bacterium]|nr:MAG: hypothetical protein CM15mP115_16490 [Alphaproteobacteria bacterium]
MKMTTEEAFVKVLQMHGIEHGFGIIGSAFMPISDLFPQAGITFWDVAHETNAGMICDGYTRATGKMSMMIAQNGPGITNFVTAVKTAYWNHTPLLLVTPQAANKTIGQGGFQEVEQMALFKDMVCLSGRGARSGPYRRGAEPCDPAGQARLGAGADQRAARFLDPGDRYRTSSHRRVRTPGRRPPGNRRGGQAAFHGEISRHPQRRRCGHRRRHPGLQGPGRAPRRAGVLRLPAQRRLSRLASALCRALGLQRLQGGDGTDCQGRRGAGAGHPAQSLFDAAGLRHRLLAEERQDHQVDINPTASA